MAAAIRPTSVAVNTLVSEPGAVAQVLPAAEIPERGTALLERLRQAPQESGFFALMRSLEALFPNRPRFGRSARPREDLLRLGQEPSAGHAPASLAGFEIGKEGRPDRLRVLFFGLFGPDGPLPLHLTEYARDRQRNYGDAALSRFIDLFHHRALSLFYRAWADVRPTVAFDRPHQDRFSHYVGSLMGLSTPGLRERDAMPDLTKLHFAGLLAGQTRHAEGWARSCPHSSRCRCAWRAFVAPGCRCRPPIIRASPRARRTPNLAGRLFWAHASGVASTSSASYSALSA